MLSRTLRPKAWAALLYKADCLNILLGLLSAASETWRNPLVQTPLWFFKPEPRGDPGCFGTPLLEFSLGCDMSGGVIYSGG